MSVHIARSRRRRQAASPDHTLRGATLTPVQRITVFTIILLVVIVLVYIGQPTCEAIGLITAAGAAAAQMGPWLSGQRAAAGSAGGV